MCFVGKGELISVWWRFEPEQSTCKPHLKHYCRTHFYNLAGTRVFDLTESLSNNTSLLFLDFFDKKMNGKLAASYLGPKLCNEVRRQDANKDWENCIGQVCVWIVVWPAVLGSQAEAKGQKSAEPSDPSFAQPSHQTYSNITSHHFDITSQQTSAVSSNILALAIVSRAVRLFT